MIEFPAALDPLYSISGLVVGGLVGFTGRLAVGSVPATIATLVVLSVLGRSSGHAANGLIASVLGFALISTAAMMLFRRFVLDYLARIPYRFLRPVLASTLAAVGIKLAI